METPLQAKKKALQIADSGDKETGLSDLTTALQGLVDNLAQQERRTVNITKVTGLKTWQICVIAYGVAKNLDFQILELDRNKQIRRFRIN